jgi:hypothetical protein
MGLSITYAVEVCTEHVELSSLLHFLVKTIEPDDDINVLVDTTKVTERVRTVLMQFEPKISISYRAFDGNFADHRNYHITQCRGDYIFMIDADEIPQERLIKSIKNVIGETGADLLYVPRMNLCPGYTEEWLKKSNFVVNPAGFINWPDYQGRVFKRDPGIKWGRHLHEKIEGSQKTMGLPADINFGLWHVKTVQKQDSQGAFYNTLPPI